MIQNKLPDEGPQWDGSGAVAGNVRSIALVSASFWIGAIISGRLVAYI